MKIIRHDHLVAIQKRIALVTVFILIIQVIINLFDSGYNLKDWFSMGYTIFLLIVFATSYFLDNKAWRGVQAIVTIITGLILNFSRLHETLILSDVLIVIGVLLLYIYRIINKYKPVTVVFITTVILVSKVIITVILQKSLRAYDLINTGFYILIIGTFISIFSKDIRWYIMRSYLLEKYMRVGMNAANLVHEQNLEVITSHIDFAVETIQEGDGERAVTILNSVADLTDKHNRNRKIFLKSFTEEYDEAITMTFDINEILESIAFFEYLNHDPETNFYIEVQKELYPDPLIMKTNKYEITGILQNLISNAVEAMRSRKERENHKLTIKTEKEDDRVIVWITDTGPGFPGADRKGKIKVDSIKSSKENGGFGYLHVTYFTRLHGGTLEIFNNSGRRGEPWSGAEQPSSDEGATIKLTLPLAEEETINDEQT